MNSIRLKFAAALLLGLPAEAETLNEAIERANYDLVKAQRELLVRQQLHNEGLFSDAGVKSYAEEVAYQQPGGRIVTSDARAI